MTSLRALASGSCALVVVMACQATATTPTASNPAPTANVPGPTSLPPTVPVPTAPVPTATPVRIGAVPTPTLINVDDMMGAIQQQTVFVTTASQVSAVTLLNHFTRYRIATNGVARLAVSPTGQWLYVLDADAPGMHRLRVFDVTSGNQRGAQTGVQDVVDDPRAMQTSADGRVYVLKSDADHAWVDGYNDYTMRPLGAVMDKPGCGDRLVISGWRAALLCLDAGEVAIGDLRGHHDAIDGSLRNVVGAGMANDGALYLVSADQRLGVVRTGATKVVSLPWPEDWSGVVVPDGLSFPNNGTLGTLTQQTDDGVWVRVFVSNTMETGPSFRLAGLPRGGVLMMWPFGYYTVGSTIRHVDLTTGLLETMTDVGADAAPGAVVNG